MDPVAVPKLTVSFAVDFAFFLLGIVELDDLLFEISPHVQGVFTSITSVGSND